MALQFEIVKYKDGDAFDGDKATSESPSKSVSLTIVDISTVRNFEITELAKIFVETEHSNKATGAGIGTEIHEGAVGTTPSKKEVTVTGGVNNFVYSQFLE